MRRAIAVPACFLAGAASVLAYAPFQAFFVVFAALGVLVWLLERASATREGAWLGFAWGLGAFVAGVSWLFVALHRYGGMPAPVAGLAIGLFCAYLALYPALVGGCYVHLRRGPAAGRAALFAGLWILSEMLRGWLFTGFPWLAVGYTQTPPSPLASLFPVLGVYGVGGVVAFVAALAASVRWRSFVPAAAAAIAFVAVIFVAMHAATRVWVAPEGPPLRVALVQTDIAQDLKWRPERVREWLDLNIELSDVEGAELVVMPESTLPLIAERLPTGYLDFLDSRARRNGSDLILGVFLRDDEGRIFNAVTSLGDSPSQSYAKRHLVPFGEYSPPLFGWFYALADIPMSDQTPGASDQPPLAVAGQRIAVNICYEDLFGRELLHALPEATLMLNVSNLAWYGHSFAQPQHLQISRVRAMESGRPMLRSTNTGMTAVVLPTGHVEAALPQFERGVLHAEVRGYVGLTPYARWGDHAPLLLAALALAFGMVMRVFGGAATPHVWRRRPEA